MFLCLLWSLTITQNSTRTVSDLDRSRPADTRSGKNGSIGADTRSEYRIGASLAQTFENRIQSASCRVNVPLGSQCDWL